MSNKIAIRIKPLKKWSDVANMSRHGLREDPAKHVNRDLTIQNIHFNFTEIETLRSDRGEITSHGDFGIVEHTDGKGLNITEEFEHLAGRTGAKWRKGAIVGTEFMFLGPCCMGQVLVTVRPYPHAQSHNRLEFGSAEFGHSVKNGDADPNFCLLVFEASRL